MASVLLASLSPLSGKTAIAVALAQRLKGEVRNVGLVRLPGDERASGDASVFAGLPFNAQKFQTPAELSTVSSLARETDLLLIEAPASLRDARADRVVVVAVPEELDQLAEF